MTTKQEISHDNWQSSFYRWLELYKEDISNGEYKAIPYSCGYCEDTSNNLYWLFNRSDSV
jgi:hypothetical protein